MFEPYAPTPYSDFSDPAALERYRSALAAVQGRLGASYPLTIGGAAVDTGNYLDSYDPGDSERLVGRSAKAGPTEIDRAMDAAWTAFADWSTWSAEARARAVMALVGVMRSRAWELAAWMTYEAGKNYREAEADVAEAIDFSDYYAREALRLDGPLPTYPYAGEENVTTLHPMGAGVVIPPWNFPLAILVGSAVAPVAAGNTVVIKPSPNTPIIAQQFMECVAAAGFPPGVFNLLTGDDAVLGDALVDHPRTRFINFTGSVVTGLRINERAAKVQPGQRFIKRVFLELGGKDGLIVDETFDLDEAAKLAVASGFGFQGQKCSAMSRLIVTATAYDGLLERFVERANALSIGHAERNADVNAVINAAAVAKIEHYQAMGREEGRLALGGGRAEGPGHYFQPTVFADVPPSSAVACEEIFGPVVSVMRARDFDHAIELANGTMFGLTGGLLSRSRERLERARREIQVGNLYLNRTITGALVGVQPFGGFKLSGTNSKGGGPDYLRLFVEAKTVTERF
jgi:1-pyrroline-5-carboxylate dehydrogenase